MGIWPSISECTGRLLRDGGEACLGRVCAEPTPPSVGYADISPSRGEIARQRRGGLTELPAGGRGGLTVGRGLVKGYRAGTGFAVGRRACGLADEGGLPVAGVAMSGGRDGAARPISPREGEMPGRAEGYGRVPRGCVGHLARHFRMHGGGCCGMAGRPASAGGVRSPPPSVGYADISPSRGEIARRRWRRPYGDRPPEAAGAPVAVSRRVGGLVVLRPTERISARRPRPWIRRPKGGRCRRRPALRESRRD